MIEFNNITKQYGGENVLAPLSFQIKAGEFFVLVGPSGSGKTTLLKMLNGLILPDYGKILRQGQDQKDIDLRKMRLDTGYVLQQIALFPNLTVAENIALIPEMKGWHREDILKHTKDLLDRVGLPHEKYLSRYPHQLSGGEQQRIGILRAIIAQPQLLLMDEPFSALDPISRRQLQDLTKDLQHERHMTTVFVTHDMKEAMRLADRICIFHQGRIVQLDTPDNIIHAPANPFVQSLFEEDV